MLRGRRARAALLVVGLCLLQACSSVKLAYNQAPHLVMWQLQRHLNLSQTQTERVRDEVQALHAWHRAALLPQHTKLLQGLAPQLQGPVTAEQACSAYREARAQVEQIAERAIPALQRLAVGLDEAQIEHLERRFARGNAEWRKEWLEPSPQALLEHRYDKLLSRAQTWYGRLGSPAKAALRDALARSSFDPERAYAERLRRQRDLVDTLRAIHARPSDAQGARTLLQAYWGRVAESPDAAYRSHAQQLVREGCELFARFHAAAEPAQRQAAVQTAQRQAADLLALAGP